jgi:hypothetical protein
MMMAEDTVDAFAFANRDEPILSFGNQASRREKLKARFGVNQNGNGPDEKNDLSIQDRLFSRYDYFLSPIS